MDMFEQNWIPDLKNLCKMTITNHSLAQDLVDLELKNPKEVKSRKHVDQIETHLFRMFPVEQLYTN